MHGICRYRHEELRLTVHDRYLHSFLSAWQHIYNKPLRLSGAASEAILKLRLVQTPQGQLQLHYGRSGAREFGTPGCGGANGVEGSGVFSKLWAAAMAAVLMFLCYRLIVPACKDLRADILRISLPSFFGNRVFCCRYRTVVRPLASVASVQVGWHFRIRRSRGGREGSLFPLGPIFSLAQI